MNKPFPIGDSPFRCFRAEEIFSTVVRGYFRDHCTDQQLENRVARLMAFADANGTPLPQQALRAQLADHQSVFDRAKSHFFFVDLCPDHAARFPVSLEDCAPPIQQVSGGGA